MPDLTTSTTLDPELAEAVRVAVQEAGQPAELADLICGGFGQVVQGSCSFDDLDDSTARLLDDLLAFVEVGEVVSSEEEEDQ